MIGAGVHCPLQLREICGIYAHLQPFRTQSGDGFLHMCERRVGEATEVDDIRAFGDKRFCTRKDLRNIHRGGVDDLREDSHVEARKVGRDAASSKIDGEIGDLLRTALERNAEFVGQHGKIGATATGQDHPFGFDRSWQPAQDNFLRHQRRHLDSNIVNSPTLRRLAEARQHPLQSRKGKMAGEEQQAFRH